jgi:hypothetical protein
LIAEKVIQEMMGIIQSLYRETQQKETDAQYVIEVCDDITQTQIELDDGGCYSCN